jgi:hypothetical protein
MSRLRARGRADLRRVPARARCEAGSARRHRDRPAVGSPSDDPPARLVRAIRRPRPTRAPSAEVRRRDTSGRTARRGHRSALGSRGCRRRRPRAGAGPHRSRPPSRLRPGRADRPIRRRRARPPVRTDPRTCAGDDRPVRSRSCDAGNECSRRLPAEAAHGRYGIPPVGEPARRALDRPRRRRRHDRGDPLGVRGTPAGGWRRRRVRRNGRSRTLRPDRSRRGASSAPVPRVLPEGRFGPIARSPGVDSGHAVRGKSASGRSP